MMIGQGFDLLRATVAELRRDPVAAVIGSIVLVVLGMLGDMGGEESLRLSFIVIGLASFALQYVLTRRAMRAGGLLANDAPGDVGGFFGLSLLSNMGILLGFVLLIVPGIWLYARWLAAAPVLFAEEKGVSEALAASAERSRPLLWPIIVATGILHGPYLVSFVASMLLPEAMIVSTGPSLAINIGLTVSQVAAWYLAIATYRLVRPEPVEAVFA